MAHLGAFPVCKGSPSNRAKEMANCPERDRLRGDIESVLGNIAQVTMLLLELFRALDSEKYEALDKELELTVGEKERAIGALRQHLKDHGCENSTSS